MTTSIGQAWIAITPSRTPVHTKCASCGATETMRDGRCAWCRTKTLPMSTDGHNAPNRLR